MNYLFNGLRHVLFIIRAVFDISKIFPSLEMVITFVITFIEVA